VTVVKLVYGNATENFDGKAACRAGVNQRRALSRAPPGNGDCAPCGAAMGRPEAPAGRGEICFLLGRAGGGKVAAGRPDGGGR